MKNPFITVVSELDRGPLAETYQIGHVVSGAHRVEMVAWRGDVLLFQRSSFTGQAPNTGVWDDRREAWSSDPDGRLRVTFTTRSISERSSPYPGATRCNTTRFRFMPGRNYVPITCAAKPMWFAWRNTRHH